MQRKDNRQEIAPISKELLYVSEHCGCFHCFNIFNSNLVSDWTSSDEEFAICPYCGSDSLVGDSQGISVTKDFLKDLQSIYFLQSFVR